MNYHGLFDKTLIFNKLYFKNSKKLKNILKYIDKH